MDEDNPSVTLDEVERLEETGNPVAPIARAIYEYENGDGGPCSTTSDPRTPGSTAD